MGRTPKAGSISRERSARARWVEREYVLLCRVYPLDRSLFLPLCAWAAPLIGVLLLIYLHLALFLGVQLSPLLALAIALGVKLGLTALLVARHLDPALERRLEALEQRLQHLGGGSLPRPAAPEVQERRLQRLGAASLPRPGAPPPEA